MEDINRALWLRRLAVAALLVGLFVLVVLVLQPFVVPVVWAAILAYATWPAYCWLRRRFGNRRSPAALVMTLLISAAIILPIIWLASLLQTEAVHAYSNVSKLLASGIKVPPQLLALPMVGDWLRDMLTRISTDPGALGGELKQLFDSSFGEVGVLIGGVGRNIAKLLTAIFSLFFMYRDGESLFQQIASVLEQFLGQSVHHYLQAIGDTVKAVVYGLVLAALAQGLLAGIGYAVAGLEGAVFLGALTTVCALIPFVVPLIWGSASLWLLLSGKTAAAIGLFLWGALAVSWIDNVVRPLVISGATRIPFLLVMFGVLGGLAAFGLVGLFIGPVILAVAIAIWREWLAEKRSAQTHQPIP
jgi:predicted PurR-regulated permease PerM